MGTTIETRWPGVETAGHLALSFVNTLDWRLRPQPVELVHTYTDLLRWAWTAGALERGEARALDSWAGSHPRQAARSLAEAVELREAIAAVFQALIRGEPTPAPALARLESELREAWAARALRPASGGAAWRWRDGDIDPARPAWSAALAAEALLTGEAKARVRQCADAHCGWMFLDASRNRSRRWCSMEGCGNRNKVRSFYRRSASRRAAGRRGRSRR